MVYKPKRWNRRGRKKKEEHHETGWDQAPAGFENRSVAEVVASNPEVIQKILLQHNNVSLIQSRRLYVGRIPPDTHQQELGSFFVSELNKRGGHKAKVVSVTINNGYAFIEFRDVDSATKGLELNGAVLRNYPLLVNRPRDYKPAKDMLGEISMDLLVSARVQPNPYCLCVHGFPSFLTRNNLEKFLSSIGSIKALQIINEPTQHCLFEFIDKDLFTEAISLLRGFKIGDHQLTCFAASDTSYINRLSQSRAGQRVTDHDINIPSKVLVIEVILGIPGFTEEAFIDSINKMCQLHKLEPNNYKYFFKNEEKIFVLYIEFDNLFQSCLLFEQLKFKVFEKKYHMKLNFLVENSENYLEVFGKEYKQLIRAEFYLD
ncbi:hypothetical protein PCE1_001020 [Barthelona sp. PCE]